MAYCVVLRPVLFIRPSRHSWRLYVRNLAQSMFSLTLQSERAKPMFALLLDFDDIYYSSHEFSCVELAFVATMETFTAAMKAFAAAVVST